MNNLRVYGKAPFQIIVVHGGPGAAGEMAPVAQKLAVKYGVLEPFQTAMSVTEQIEELRWVLQNHGTLPIILIGYSWGAWLSYMLAAQYPTLVKKLILVSSGSFEDFYVQGRSQVRLSRLNNEERAEFELLANTFDTLEGDEKNIALGRLGLLSLRADTYDALTSIDRDFASLALRADIFQAVWSEAADMRRSGKLLALGQQIMCPVVAIHGDYDSHPAEGVQKPLSGIVADFEFILLEQCGHKPWIERWAREKFYAILRQACS